MMAWKAFLLRHPPSLVTRLGDTKLALYQFGADTLNNHSMLDLQVILFPMCSIELLERGFSSLEDRVCIRELSSSPRQVI